MVTCRCPEMVAAASRSFGPKPSNAFAPLRQTHLPCQVKQNRYRTYTCRNNTSTYVFYDAEVDGILNIKSGNLKKPSSKCQYARKSHTLSTSGWLLYIYIIIYTNINKYNYIHNYILTLLHIHMRKMNTHHEPICSALRGEFARGIQPGKWGDTLGYHFWIYLWVSPV
jgi:hypothetical protein